ncbi:MAG: cupin domain-containing protein [Pyrinomonadaceae bacterium]|nr:cupin domain-containing protein [Pyrinomonadaceae bacterium]
MKLIFCAFALTVASSSIALGQVAQTQTHDMGDSKSAEMSLYPAADIQWKDGPASLATGAKVAVLEGDPSKEGFFTMRLWFPDGFKVQPHWHPRIEHVTVIKGTLNIGMGEKFDQAVTRAMPEGTFGFWPAGMRHFAWAKGDTIIQLHGIGPWVITYINAADDPRNMKK